MDANLSVPPSERLRPEMIVRAVLEAEQRDWSAFFEIFRQQTYKKLRAAKTETERIEIQQTVKAFDLVEAIFVRIREDKKIVLDIHPK